MKVKLIILLIALAFLIVSCSSIWISSLPGCPVEIGDKVVRITDGKIGNVISIGGWGSATDNCSIAVHHQDGSITEDFVYNWHYSKL